MVRFRASKTILKMCCKSFIVYLGIRSATAQKTITERFSTKSPMGWLDNLSLNSRDEKELNRETEENSL